MTSRPNIAATPPEGAQTSMPSEDWGGNWFQGRGGYWYPTGMDTTETSGSGGDSGQPSQPKPTPEQPKESTTPETKAESIPETKTPEEPAEGLTPEERGFTPAPSWKLVEKTAQGKPAVYVDEKGYRQYAPASTMWKLGYRSGGRMKEGGGIEYATGNTVQGQYRGGGTGEHAFVAVKTAEGTKHITQAEATKLTKLSEKGQFDELQSMGIIPKTDSTGAKIRWRGTREQQSAKIKDHVDAVQTLRQYINRDNLDLYGAAAAAGNSEKVRQALYDLGYSHEVITDSIRTMRTMTKFKDKDTGGYNIAEAINAEVPKADIVAVFGQDAYNEGRKGALTIMKLSKYRSASTGEYNIAEAIDSGTPKADIVAMFGDKAYAEAALFVKEHKRLADGKWISYDEWNKLPAAYQGIGQTKGFDAMLDNISSDEVASEKALRIMEAYKISTPAKSDITSNIKDNISGWQKVTPWKEELGETVFSSLRGVGNSVQQVIQAIKATKEGKNLDYTKVQNMYNSLLSELQLTEDVFKAPDLLIHTEAPKGGTLGGYDRFNNRIEIWIGGRGGESLRDTLMHETAHAVTMPFEKGNKPREGYEPRRYLQHEFERAYFVQHVAPDNKYLKDQLSL